MCTSIAVGKQASADGAILLGRNEDFEVNNWNKYLKYRSSPPYDRNSETWTLGNGLTVKTPKEFYCYSAIPDAKGKEEAAFDVGDFFYFEERGINEYNVAISATNSMDMNQKAKQADPPAAIGLEEAILPTLILPQVTSARNAVLLLGKYMKDYGASEANGILIADPEEAWYFEIGSCHHWIAVKIPENSYLVVANNMRVHSVNLEAEDVLHSEGLFTFVKENELLEQPVMNSFDFAEAFGCQGSKTGNLYDAYYNLDRIWLAQNILSPSRKLKPRSKKKYPLFLEPDQKITLTHVMQVFRAGYKGTALEGIASRNIGVVRTAESHIMALDPNLPGRLKGIIWQTIGSPLGSPYLPIFAVTEKIPESYAKGESQYDSQSAYWSFRSLYSLAALCEISILDAVWFFYEKQYMKEYHRLKNKLIRDKKAEDLAKDFSFRILCQAAEIANEKLYQLLTDIATSQKDDVPWQKMFFGSISDILH